MDGLMVSDRGDGMPAPKGHHRKMLSVNLEMALAIRKLRFELELDSEADAYRLLLQKGLEAIQTERDERGRAPAPTKPRGRRG
jgi:hypothetical protein